MTSASELTGTNRPPSLASASLPISRGEDTSKEEGQRFKCARNDVVVVPKARVPLEVGVILAHVLPDQGHAIRDVRLILLVIRDHMVDAWIGRVAVPNYISTCVEIDSPAPSPKGGLEFRMDVSRMSHSKVEDEVASGIRGQRSVWAQAGPRSP